MNRLLFLLPVLFMACGTQPKTANGAQTAAVKMQGGEPAAKEEIAAERPAEKEPDKQAKAEIDPVVGNARNSGGLEDESYEEVFNEVKAFIENLNKIIQSKDYNKWRDALSKERLDEISSPEFLANVSNSEAMKKRGITVNSVNDYFLNVVVPSRANSQVDKIEILDNNKVRAFYMSSRRVVSGNKTRTETVPLLVYELRKSGNSWTIIQ